MEGSDVKINSDACSSSVERGKLDNQERSSTSNMFVHDESFKNCIFARLDVKTLLQIRCVCKTWCSMIDDPYLATHHLNNNNNDACVLLVRWDRKSDDSVFFRWLVRMDPENKKCNTNSVSELGFKNPRFYNVCNGLTCFSVQAPSQQADPYNVADVYLCNPFRKDILKLPVAPTSCSTVSYGFGVDSVSNTYKVVHVYHDTRFAQNVQIHTLGTKSWRAVRETPPLRIWTSKPVYANGSLYWLASEGSRMFEMYDRSEILIPDFGHWNDPKIVTFDLASEVFYITSTSHLGISYFTLFNLQGSLALFTHSTPDKHGEIWVLMKGNTNKKSEWVRKYQLNSKNFHIVVFSGVVGMWDDVHLLCWSGDSLVLYNTKTDQWRRVYHVEVNEFHEVVGFERSLILPSRLSNINMYSDGRT